MRRDMARKMSRKSRKAKAKARKNVDSDSNSYSSSSCSESEEDVIQVKLDLKRGDDVVKMLLDLWTPQRHGPGKEMLTV